MTKKSREELNAAQRAYYARNREAVCERQRARGALAREDKRDYDRQFRYTMTADQFYALLASQDYGCAICHAPIDAESANVDHDHFCCDQKRRACGSCNRALLCGKCNRGLGMFNDDPEILRAAISYLSLHDLVAKKG